MGFQNSIVQFQNAVGDIHNDGAHCPLKDSRGVEITFFRMKDNQIHHLKEGAGLFAYGRVKENNRPEIIYIGETDNFREMSFPPRLEKALHVNPPYELFIAIAPQEDKSFRVEVVKRLSEHYPENLPLVTTDI